MTDMFKGDDAGLVGLKPFMELVSRWRLEASVADMTGDEPRSAAFSRVASELDLLVAASLARPTDDASLVKDALEACDAIKAFPSNQGCVEGRITEKGARELSAYAHTIRAALTPPVEAKPAEGERPDLEVIARIIDPEPWAHVDRWYVHGERINVDRSVVKPSVDKARAILALIPARDEAALSEPVAWTDEKVEKAARAHDEEDAAQRGEPTPWLHYNCDSAAESAATCSDCIAFKAERLSAMRKGLEALIPQPHPATGADELPADVVRLVKAVQNIDAVVYTGPLDPDGRRAIGDAIDAVEPFASRVPLNDGEGR